MSDELKNFLENWPKPAEVVSLGVLNLDTPALAICDPVGIALTELSGQSVFIDGVFPLGEAQLSVKKWSVRNQSHVAFVVVNFSELEISSWQPAEKAGGPHLFEDFEVDYGNVGFMSQAMHASFMAKAAEFGDDAYDEWLWPFIDGEGEDDTTDIAEIPLPTGAIFKAASAPGGNGAYDAFIGRGADGSIVSVAVDLISPTLDII